LNNDPEFSFDKHYLAAVQGSLNDVGITAKAVYRAFDAMPLDESSNGITEAECINLLADFCYYCEEVKKNIKTQQTTPESMEQIKAEPETTNTN
jgi:hypothetical protein